MKQGLSLSAKAHRIYPGKELFDSIRVVHIQLRIDFLDNTRLSVMTKCLMQTNPSHLEGHTIQFKYLPGDLSQIALPY